MNNISSFRYFRNLKSGSSKNKNMNRDIAIGADIGGSHISCAAVNIKTGKILKETLTGREVDNQAHANVIIGVWAEALSEVLSKVPRERVKGIGFAMPGPFDYVKGISLYKGSHQI